MLYPAWGFAEGTTGVSTFFALLNPTATATTVRIAYLHENGTRYMADVALPAHARATAVTPSWRPAGAFSATLTSLDGVDFVAERMGYASDFRYGYAGPGRRAGTTWALVEGPITDFFDTFVALGNPWPDAVSVTLKYLNAGQVLQTQTVTVPAHSRRTVLVDTAGIGATAFQTQVTSSQAIYVDRITYWPGVVTATGATAAPPTGDETPSFVVTGPDDGARAPSTLPPGTGPPPDYGDVVQGTPANDAAVQAAMAEPAAGPAPAAPPTATSSSGWYGAHLTAGVRR